MPTKTGPTILISDLVTILEGVNRSLDLSVQVEPKDPNVLRLVDSKGDTMGFVDLPLRKVIWQRR